MGAIFILLVVMVVLFVIFVLQNPSIIRLQLLLWEVNAPLSITVLVFFVSGFLLAVFWLVPNVWKKKQEIRLLKNKIEELNSDCDDDNNPEGPKLGDDSFKSFFND